VLPAARMSRSIIPCEAVAHSPPEPLADGEPCPVCGVLDRHHPPSGMEPLITATDRAWARKKLKRALDQLTAGKGLYAEASLIAGWLNMNHEP
jgi:hypothetical protein